MSRVLPFALAFALTASACGRSGLRTELDFDGTNGVNATDASAPRNMPSSRAGAEGGAGRTMNATEPAGRGASPAVRDAGLPVKKPDRRPDAGVMRPDAGVPDRCAINHGGCDPRVTCTNAASGPRCGACPAPYVDDAAGGCRKRFGAQFGSSADDSATDLAIDPQGNLFIAGVTYGSLGGLPNAGSYDAFLVKYDRDAARLWTREFGSSAGEDVTGVAADAAGNAYVAGSTSGALDDAEDAGGLDYDGFLVKFDSLGTMLWRRQLGSSADDRVYGVATDAKGFVYVAGTTSGSVAGNPNGGGSDAFVAKYSSDGAQLWSRQFGGSDDEGALAVTVDPAGYVYAVGFGAIEPSKPATLLVRLDGDGNVQLYATISAPSYLVPTDAVADDTNLYISGWTAAAVDGGTSRGVAVVLKYDGMAREQWRRVRTTDFGTSATRIALDAKGGVYMAGSREKQTADSQTSSDQDALLAKYDTEGNELWSRQFGSTLPDFATGLAVGSEGYVYVAGHTYGELGDNAYAGGGDSFLVAYDGAGNPR